MAEATKVGIIACSGEEIAAGTISRLAVRRVLELLRPQSTVTLCLPLFLAGEEQERRFARQHPTITVDGCDKRCARRGTERHSGQVAASLVATEVLGQRLEKCHRSARDSGKPEEEAIWLLAERIASEVDALASAAPVEQESGVTQAASCGCSCGAPPAGTLRLNGRTVTIQGLPLIFDHLRKNGLAPDSDCGGVLLDTVRIYHAVEPGEEDEYRQPLIDAYRAYCGG